MKKKEDDTYVTQKVFLFITKILVILGDTAAEGSRAISPLF